MVKGGSTGPEAGALLCDPGQVTVLLSVLASFSTKDGNYT